MVPGSARDAVYVAGKVAQIFRDDHETYSTFRRIDVRDVGCGDSVRLWAAHAQDGIDKAKAAAFDKRLFAGPVGEKTDACFVRQYDGSHLTQHPKQKVSAMKLLVTAEIPPAEKTTSYSFRLGIKYRHRSGNFDSSGYCNHVVAESAGNEIRFGCGVDCEGGGINVAR
jgi:hypothetical protein